MGTVSKPYDFTTGVIDPDEVNDDFDTLYTLVNGNLSTVNIEDGTLTDDEMSTEVKPVTRYDENFQSHVHSGMALSTSGLTATCAVGTAYVDGVRVVVSATSSNACDTSDTTYVDLSKTGAFSWNKNETASSGYMRLYSVSCDSTEITGTTAIRPLTAVGADEIEVDAATKVYSATNTATVSNTTTTAATCIDLGTVDVNVGDDLVYMAQAIVIGNTALNVYGMMNIGGTDVDIIDAQAVTNTTAYQALGLTGAYAVTTASTSLPVIFTFKTAGTAGTATASMRSITVVRHRR